jgi:GlpG protein
MRLIGYVKGEYEAERFSSYLKKQGIDSKFEPSMNSQTKEISYGCWILDEDQIQEALGYFAQFQQNPLDSQYDPPLVIKPLEREIPPAAAQKKHFFTMFIVALCTFIFFMNYLQEKEIDTKGFVMTPIQTALFYDFPEIVEKKLGPYWHGFYDWMIVKWNHQNLQEVDGPWFIQIRKGEVWRLFSPAVLHTEFFHIFFNMIWLWILSRPIEEKIGMGKIGLLSLILAVFSNTVQYLIGGPLFLGYSGVVMGLAGFTYMRQKIAPWEGYPLDRMTFLFLILFVSVMFVLSLVSFVLQMFASIAFVPSIANAAHLSGGFLGLLLGRLRFFSWKGNL